MTDSFTKFDLNRHTARLLFSEPFFAALSRRIDKRANRSIPTAGVRVNPESGYFELSYNPEFFAKLTDKEMTGVLKHEFYHLIFDSYLYLTKEYIVWQPLRGIIFGFFLKTIVEKVSNIRYLQKDQ